MDARDAQLALNTARRRLVLLRTFMIAGLGIVIAVVDLGLGIPLPLMPMAAAVVLLVLLNALVFWRMRSGVPVTRAALFTQMLVDVGVLTLLLYCAGGSGNPFVSFYLLPLVITAVMLPRAHTAVMAVITVVCYSALMFWYVPLPAHMHHFQLHVIGMWCNFVLSAGLIVFFVAHIASVLRERERELAQSRERALRDEHIVSLGTLAAGAAHELATPLSTMAVVTREMETADDLDAEQQASMDCLREQIETCKTTLGRLRNFSVEHSRREEAADLWVRRLVDDWRVLRPATPVACHWSGPQPAPKLSCDDGLGRTLANLINNAADASPSGVSMQGHATDRELVIEIRDAGAGVAADISARAKRPGTTSKAGGHGLGLMLANATVERLGGRLQWFDRAEGGVCTRLALPLDAVGAT